MTAALGRLERVDVRSVWSTEDRHFTPWLALPQNIDVLSQTLNMELEVEEVERYVGNYKADIICRDTEDSSLVLIENQFEKTDHKHLGQILTYTAGAGAKTIIWIAERFAEEHREAINWLNEQTADDFRFFGLEVELWRIGQSDPAPKFNIVSKPNDWTRTIRRAARNIGDGELTDTKEMYLRYWSAFRDLLAERYPSILRSRSPRPQHWFLFSVGRTGFGLSASISAQKRKISVELYIKNERAEGCFEALAEDREEIERDFGEPLDWRPLPHRKSSRILIVADYDPTDEASWPQQHEWLASKLQKFRSVFESRIRALDLDALQMEEDDKEALD